MSSPLRKLLHSTIGKKLVIGVTGLGLVGFTVVHLAGNLLLYFGFEKYNHYAHSLHSMALLPAAEIGLLLLFALHIFYAIGISIENRKAREVAYAVKRSKQGQSQATPSAMMFVSGTIILGFVLLHLADFRFHLRFPMMEGELPADRAFRILQDPITASVYFLGSLFLGYHLVHGIQSAFQTWGINSTKYNPWIRKIGVALAILLALGFASLPAWATLKKWGIF